MRHVVCIRVRVLALLLWSECKHNHNAGYGILIIIIKTQDREDMRSHISQTLLTMR